MTLSLAVVPIFVLRFLGDVLAVVVGVVTWDRWLRKQGLLVGWQVGVSSDQNEEGLEGWPAEP